MNFGKYQLWHFCGDDVDQVNQALSKGEVDGVFVGRIHGFKKANLESLLAINNLKILAIGDALDIEITALNYLKHLEFLSIGDINQKDVVNLRNFPNLNHLRFTQQKNIQLPPSGLPKLKELAIWSFGESTLQILNAYQRLHHLELIQAKKLESLAGLEACTELVHLVVAYCPKLLNINALELLAHLESLDIQNAKKIESFLSISFLISIKKLMLRNVSPMNNLHFLENCIKLEHLVLRNSPVVSNDLKPLLNLPKLRHTYLDKKAAYEPTYSRIDGLIADRKKAISISRVQH